jgi:hypothetical protein
MLDFRFMLVMMLVGKLLQVLLLLLLPSVQLVVM